MMYFLHYLLFDTVNFLIESSNPLRSPNSVVIFAGKVEDLPFNSSVARLLSTTLSSSASHGSERRPFRCPCCGHTCPSGNFRFFHTVGTPWIVDHGCECEIQLPLRYSRDIYTGENRTRTDCINSTK